MKKCIGVIRAIILFAAISAAAALSSVEAKAAASYEEYSITSESDAVECGNYYFKYSYETHKVSISPEKDGEYTETSIYYNFYSDGKQAYYVNNNVLRLYVFSTGKDSKVKTLKTGSDTYSSIGCFYKNYIYINRVDDSAGKIYVYSYNIKTAKLKLVMKNLSIDDRYKTYVVGVNTHVTDVSACKTSLYKIKSDGSLKLVKVIGNNIRCAAFDNGKLYYSAYPNKKTVKIGTQKMSYYSLDKVVVYKANPNGGSPKKIVTIKSSKSQYGEVLVYNITSKNFYVYKDGTTYIYTYSTKKYTKVN